MMHLVRAGAATAFLLLCTLLPFVPGPYDAFAVPLSLMAWTFGKVGLLLVPVGLFGLLVESRHFALVARIAGSLVVLAISLAAFAFSGFTLGLAFLALAGAAVWRIGRRSSPGRSTPILFVVVPLAVAALQGVLIPPVTEASRLRSIDSYASLIADIERYRAERGRYPLSLHALYQDYDDPPPALGVRGYVYDPHRESYNVSFEHPTFALGTREIVVYNPRDEQVVISHDSDILLWSPAELESRLRFQSGLAAGRPHWKYFWFD